MNEHSAYADLELEMWASEMGRDSHGGQMRMNWWSVDWWPAGGGSWDHGLFGCSVFWLVGFLARAFLKL